MAISIAYAAGYAPNPARPQTFSQEEDRARLTPGAIHGVKGIADAWGLTRNQTAALLAVSPSSWDRMLAGTGAKQLFSQDQMIRASALIGIFKGLNLLFADDMADRWPTLKNIGPLFAGNTPVDAMIEGGIPLMIEIRRYVDAMRGGL
jgi:hypothetical protein